MGTVTNTIRLTTNTRQDTAPAWVAIDGSADADNDGLTAAGEFQAGTSANKADCDGDGMKDGAEVTAGTGPRDAASVFSTRLVRDAAGLVLTWNPGGLSGRAYTIQKTTSLAGGFANWVSVSATNQYRLPTTGVGSAFYRVAVTMP